MLSGRATGLLIRREDWLEYCCSSLVRKSLLGMTWAARSGGLRWVLWLAAALILFGGIYGDAALLRRQDVECGRSGQCVFVSTVPYNSTGCGDVCGTTEACACDSLQAAIDIIPPNSTAAVMLVAASGTYTGPGNVGVDFHGVSVTLVAAQGSAETTIECSPGESAFLFHSGESNSTQVAGFTLNTCSLSVSNRKRLLHNHLAPRSCLLPAAHRGLVCV